MIIAAFYDIANMLALFILPARMLVSVSGNIFTFRNTTRTNDLLL